MYIYMYVCVTALPLEDQGNFSLVDVKGHTGGDHKKKACYWKILVSSHKKYFNLKGITFSLKMNTKQGRS